MRKSILIAMSFALCTLVPAALFARGNPNTCGTTDVVSNPVLTIDGPSGYNITSSDGGSYQNTDTKGNKIGVGFQIGNCSYDFTMNLSQSSRPINVVFPAGFPQFQPTTAWFFNFDRIGSVPITDGGTVYDDWCGVDNDGNVQINPDGSFKTNNITNMPYDNYGGCDTDLTGAFFARRNVGFSLANDYRLRFQNSPFDSNIDIADYPTKTSYIKVYHPNATTWYLEPEDTAVSVLFHYTKGNTRISDGYPAPMRFRMTITTTP